LTGIATGALSFRYCTYNDKPVNQNEPYFGQRLMNRSISSSGSFSRRHALLSIVLLVAVTGCTPLQTTGDMDASPDTARSKAAQGDHAAASRDYLDLAVASSEIQRERYLIFAAHELYLANDLDSARRIMTDVGAETGRQNLEIWAEVTALLKLSEGDAQGALSVLNRVSETSDRDAARRILRLRADALFRLGRPEAAVATLIQREEMLNRQREIADNHRLIWSGLQESGASISRDTSGRGDAVLEGWLELGYIGYSRRGSLTNLRAGLEEWRQQNSGHPADADLLDEILVSLGAFSSYPESVAVLLPLSGKQQREGEAIRDGYLAAHFSLGQDADRPVINFYDTARNGAAAAYQQAIIGGAEFVVGPLLKNEISAVASLAESSATTTLALNYAADEFDPPPGFYQFALAPEDEARRVAIRATNEGLFNAVALVSEGNWGERVLLAFQEELDSRGGKLLAARKYPADTQDFSTAIREALLLNESYARRERLVANIGKRLEFKPRRRQDVDLIFVGANAAKAKLIRPQLRFHYAGDISTFGTSAVYEPGSDNNADINGMVFPVIPWLLEPNQSVTDAQAVLTRYWGAGMQRRARFYAMGYDAYRLTAILNGRTNTGPLAINGMTGRIYMDRIGRLHRELRWARMERGRPRPLPDILQGLSQDAEMVISRQ
jgi:hypothetical protein